MSVVVVMLISETRTFSCCSCLRRESCQGMARRDVSVDVLKRVECVKVEDKVKARGMRCIKMLWQGIAL